MAESLDIAAVARLTGLTSRALRFYEARGLVTPLRSASGRRHYGPAELERLHQVMAMKRAGLTLGQIEKLSAGRRIDLAKLVAAQIEALDERQRELDAARSLLSSVLSRLDRSEPIDVATFCSLIHQGETVMSAEKWFEAASSQMTAEQRAAVEKIKAALPAGFDGKAQMARFQELNARIKAALPLDPASDEAQRFLDERDTMLQPFVALMPPEIKEASKTLREKIRQGEFSSPIDAEVDRFYQEARRARETMKGG
ncbi:MAG: MerR family transcriptional regulator [Porphyrobacter sp.]|nr:MerR family transcriptional regulator [Porphyrobacter sp.]